MYKLYLIVLIIGFIGCTSNDKTVSNQKVEKDTLKVDNADSINMEEVQPEMDPYNFFDDYKRWIFESEMMHNHDEAWSHLHEYSMKFEEVYSPEENLEKIFVSETSVDNANKYDLAYYYDATSGRFQGMRHIVSRIKDDFRPLLINDLEKIMNDRYGEEGIPYSKSYGEFGLLWDQSMDGIRQVVLTKSNGNREKWIEVSIYLYNHVKDKERNTSLEN